MLAYGNNSSDGYVSSKVYPKTKTAHGGRSTRIRITSSERDWLEHIKKILKNIGIKSSVCQSKSDKSKLSNKQIYRLDLRQVRQIYEAIKDDGEIFLMKRKFEPLKEGYALEP